MGSEKRVFVESISRLLADQDGLVQKFEDLNHSVDLCSPEFSTKAALEHNSKNRYINILPFDSTRVRLEDSPDYINANFVQARGCPYQYIATQGPLPSTFVDFWEMVWQNNVNIVLMLTNLKENGIIKCHKYWTEEKEIYGSLSLKMEKEISKDTYVERQFILSKEKTEKRVKQIQFTAWPDHGVPTSTESVLSLVSLVREHTSATSPVVVHCSAGIGRTGTFCTIDSALYLIESGQAPDGADVINEIITEYRTQRIGMVQTSGQHRFCYKAVLDKITSS